MVFHGRGQWAGAWQEPGLGAEPLFQLCVPLCCAGQSALPWGKCKSPWLSLCSVLTPWNWDRPNPNPSQACLCPGASLTWG